MEIKFFTVDVGGHTDERRIISDFCLPNDFTIPFGVRQVKVVQLSEKAIKDGLVVGNHYHTEESDRWELFVMLGSFKFRFRRGKGAIQEREMHSGEACLIPPTWSHAFVGLIDNSAIWGLSNIPYDARHDVPDKLFV